MKTVSFDESEWQLVPVEPDANQIYAMRSAFSKARRGGIGGQTMDACYQRENAPELSAYSAMLAAAPTPAEAPADVVRDAERYRWLRNWTRRAYGIDSNPAFILPHVPIPTGPDQNIMRGSLAQHLDNAIDAAIERDKKGDQS